MKRKLLIGLAAGALALGPSAAFADVDDNGDNGDNGEVIDEENGDDLDNGVAEDNDVDDNGVDEDNGIDDDEEVDEVEETEEEREAPTRVDAGSGGLATDGTPLWAFGLMALGGAAVAAPAVAGRRESAVRS